MVRYSGGTIATRMPLAGRESGTFLDILWARILAPETVSFLGRLSGLVEWRCAVLGPSCAIWWQAGCFWVEAGVWAGGLACP